MRFRLASRHVLVALAAGVVAAVAAGCGSSNTSSTSGDGSSGTAFQAAAKATAKMQQRPTSIGLTTPVGKKIPSGKTIDFIQCGVPACAVEGDILASATKLLGWKLKRIDAGTTPEKIKAAYDQAVSDKPDAVLGSGYPRVLFNPELAKLKAMGIPVVEAFVEDTPGNGLTAVIAGKKETDIAGKELADYILANNGSKSFTVGQVYVSGFPTTIEVASAMRAEIKAQCPDCKIAQLQVPVTSIGADLPQRVTSFLTSHPDVKWTSVAYDDLVVGLPTALKGAGLTDTKIVTLNINTAVAPYLKNNQYLQMAFDTSFQETYWREIDLLARYFTHQPYDADMDDATLPYWSITGKTVPSTTQDFPAVVDYVDQFKKLWGLTS